MKEQTIRCKHLNHSQALRDAAWGKNVNSWLTWNWDHYTFHCMCSDEVLKEIKEGAAFLMGEDK